MSAFRVETTVESDGELHLTELPCRRGDKVEVIVHILESASGHTTGAGWETARAAAVEQLLALARASRLCSVGPYSTRDELHERP